MTTDDALACECGQEWPPLEVGQSIECTCTRVWVLTAAGLAELAAN